MFFNTEQINLQTFISFSNTIAAVVTCSEYSAVNITTNLYVISQPWLYSLAWCSGVHSVTTNAPQLLRTLKSPLLLMVGLPTTRAVLLFLWLILSLKTFLC